MHREDIKRLVKASEALMDRYPPYRGNPTREDLAAWFELRESTRKVGQAIYDEEAWEIREADLRERDGRG